ncbi:MAG TPA: hypothetical protein VIV82_12815, partial [Verrucomicrobiae bacterium]
LVPAGAIAAVAVIGIIAGRQFLPTQLASAESEMTVADSGAFTYHDYAHGTTLVWVSYPADH